MCVTNIVGCEGNTAASCAGQNTIPGEIFQCTHMQPSSLLQMVNTVVLTAELIYLQQRMLEMNRRMITFIVKVQPNLSVARKSLGKGTIVAYQIVTILLATGKSRKN